MDIASFDKNPLGSEQHQRLFESYLNLNHDVLSLLNKNTLTYDSYMEAYISRFRFCDSDMINVLIASPFDITASPDESDHTNATNELVAHFDSIKPTASKLLLDPCIGMRAEEFSYFLEKNKAKDILEIRRQYINTFPIETYFRGYVFSDGQDLSANSQYSASVRNALLHMDKFIAKCNENLESDFEGVKKKSSYYLFRYSLPFLTDFIWQTIRHTRAQTHRDLISVTKYPEIAWYATVDNKKQKWKDMSDSTFLRIYRFPMNSFYALSTLRFVHESKMSSEPILIDNGDQHYEIPINSEGIECVVPLSIPRDFASDFRDFRPIIDTLTRRPISFHIPTEEDW